MQKINIKDKDLKDYTAFYVSLVAWTLFWMAVGMSQASRYPTSAAQSTPEPTEVTQESTYMVASIPVYEIAPEEIPDYPLDGIKEYRDRRGSNVTDEFIDQVYLSCDEDLELTTLVMAMSVKECGINFGVCTNGNGTKTKWNIWGISRYQNYDPQDMKTMTDRACEVIGNQYRDITTNSKKTWAYVCGPKAPTCDGVEAYQNTVKGAIKGMNK